MDAVLKPTAVAGGSPARRARLYRRRGRWVVRRILRAVRARAGSDAGMTTAEYAVGTLGACALAAGLYKVVTSPAVLGALTDVLDRALHAT
ncbi:DUF4244 domain-containing protein [Kitasatospora sp. NBC_00458]|uniref:DUF4244 domain-containing protein n=1 Tax=Kitasatospora sp. NBC_00458 TaxID=2903568 RepID=UPI002E18AB00